MTSSLQCDLMMAFSRNACLKAALLIKYFRRHRPPHTLEVVVKGGLDISKLPGADKIPDLMLEYGTASGIPLADVPADYLPIVQLIRDKKIVLKTVENNRPKPVTHYNYGYVLAQLRGDVALQLYGGDRHKEALKIAFITKGNLILRWNTSQELGRDVI